MRKAKIISEQHQQRCVHYQRSGLLAGDKCNVGVVYDTLSKVNQLGYAGCMLRLPCIRSHHDEKERQGQPLCECSQLRWPTIEESAAYEAEAKLHHVKIMTALNATAALRKEHKGQDWTGSIDCPVCKGRLHCRHSGFNGHVWAKCETAGCVAWME